MGKDFEEVLIVGKDKVYLRKCYRPGDIYNLFPRGEYEEREATEEDIKRVAPSLYGLIANNGGHVPDIGGAYADAMERWGEERNK